MILLSILFITALSLIIIGLLVWLWKLEQVIERLDRAAFASMIDQASLRDLLIEKDVLNLNEATIIDKDRAIRFINRRMPFYIEPNLEGPQK